MLGEKSLDFSVFLREKCGITLHIKMVLVDRFFPSGEINERLTLADREWTCEGCGTRHDRDFNASCNLEFVAASSTET